MAASQTKKTPAASKLDSEQVLKASKALLKHVHNDSAKQQPAKTNLLATDVDSPENDTAIWLSLTTKKFIVDKKRLKPARIPLAHSFTPADATVCLFVKDPQRTYKDMIDQAELSTIVTRVVGISKLKEKHKSFEAKRALRDAHDIFLSDDRVVALLPQLLGKTFYQAKKNPIPISIPLNTTKTDNLKIEITKAMNSTSLHLSPGTCTMIRVGLAGQTPEQIADNIEMVAARVVDQFVPQKWAGVRSLHIKTSTSVALPIWQMDAVFDPETDKVAAAKESQAAIADTENKTGTSKKRKAGKEVPGISLEAVENVPNQGTPPAKKVKTSDTKAKKTVSAAGKKQTKPDKSVTRPSSAAGPKQVKQPPVVAPQISNSDKVRKGKK